MARLYLVLLLSFAFLSLNAQDKAVQSYQLVKSKNAIQYKSYYLLTLLQEIPAVKKLVISDLVFTNFLKQKKGQANQALKNCKPDVNCYADALQFSDMEIAIIGKRLNALYQKQNELGLLVSQHLIPSGCYGNLQEESAQELLVKAWEQDAKAINHTIDVYIRGKKPNYPKIDSISFRTNDKEFIELTNTSVTLSNNSATLFFEPGMYFALAALELNDRNDAADYEPMESTINQAAIVQIKKTDWKKYPYSIILVPGAGPEDKETVLSAGGMVRCRLAAIQYRNGKAPFIVVSGGRVHPYKTKYSEAFEMKEYLMQRLNIPESAIIMEPHARHTTTNMRNSVRLMFRYGLPMDKPAITSTVKSQSFYITALVNERSKKELGYYPYRNGNRLTDTEAEFYPDATSLQIDIDEPLDP